MSETLLRPRSAVEIIDASFVLYRTNFATLTAISVALIGPFQIAGVLIGGWVGALISTLSGFLAPVVAGATVAVVSDAMHDRRASIGRAFGQIAGRWGLLALVSLAQGILVFLGMIFLVVPGIIAACWTFAAPMAVVVERVSNTSGAIGRSRQLARGQFWHILGTLALVWIIMIVLMFAISIGVGMLSRLVGLGEAASDFLGSWAIILAMPIFATASGILYFDLRIRTEAYDIEHLAQSIGTEVPA